MDREWHFKVFRFESRVPYFIHDFSVAELFEYSITANYDKIEVFFYPEATNFWLWNNNFFIPTISLIFCLNVSNSP